MSKSIAAFLLGFFIMTVAQAHAAPGDRVDVHRASDGVLLQSLAPGGVLDLRGARADMGLQLFFRSNLTSDGVEIDYNVAGRSESTSLAELRLAQKRIYRVARALPYSLTPEASGKALAWFPGAGDHLLTIRPFRLVAGRREMIADRAVELRFRVLRDNVAAQCPMNTAPQFGEAPDVPLVPTADRGKVLFAGSSTFAMWPGNSVHPFARAFPGLPKLNTAIGGTTFDAWLRRDVHTGITRHQPSIAVIYLGSNDQGGLTPERIRDKLKQLILTVKRRSPSTKFVIASVNPRMNNDLAKIERTNCLMRLVIDPESVGDRCGETVVDERFAACGVFADTYSAIRGTGAEPRWDLFSDGVHPTGEGYRVIESVLAPKIRELSAVTTSSVDPLLAAMPGQGNASAGSRASATLIRKWRNTRDLEVGASYAGSIRYRIVNAAGGVVLEGHANIRPAPEWTFLVRTASLAVGRYRMVVTPVSWASGNLTGGWGAAKVHTFEVTQQ